MKAMRIRYILKVLFPTLLLCFSVSVPVDSKAENQAYKFGVFPYLSKKIMREIYSPVNGILNKGLKDGSVLMFEASHKNFIFRLNNGFYDVVLVPPFWYPAAVDRNNYIPLLKMKEPFSALIIVLDNSSINSIDDLKGQVIATPPVFSPVVNLAISALVEQGVIPGVDVKLLENETVDSCLQRLIASMASACVMPSYAVAFFENERKLKLRTVLTSSSIPGVSLLAHSRVGISDRDKIVDMFFSLNDSKIGREILQEMQTEGFVSIEDGEYDVVRKLLKKSKLMH